MKKTFLTFLLMSSMAFVYGQNMIIKNGTSHDITVEIWRVTLPTCAPGCMVATGVTIPAGSMQIFAPTGCTIWGRVIVQAGGTGTIGNPDYACASIDTVGGGISAHWDPACDTCDAVVAFEE